VQGRLRATEELPTTHLDAELLVRESVEPPDREPHRPGDGGNVREQGTGGTPPGHARLERLHAFRGGPREYPTRVGAHAWILAPPAQLTLGVLVDPPTGHPAEEGGSAKPSPRTLVGITLISRVLS
jgi:hypothetical protein